MKKVMPLIIILLFIVSGCTTAKAPQKSSNVNQPTSQNNTSGNQGNTGTPNNTQGNNQGSSGITKVKLFMIAIEDNGKSGKKIGAGDSAVPVEVTIELTNEPLKAALNKLLSIKDRNYGQSGLYNALYQSDLKLESAVINNGEAVIKLSGNLKLGGVLDNPRVKAQLEETALQFDTVKKVSIFIKGKKLDDVLSLKGD